MAASFADLLTQFAGSSVPEPTGRPPSQRTGDVVVFGDVFALSLTISTPDGPVVIDADTLAGLVGLGVTKGDLLGIGQDTLTALYGKMDATIVALSALLSAFESSLPTSDAGLAVGAWWSNGGILTRVKVAS